MTKTPMTLYVVPALYLLIAIEGMVACGGGAPGEVATAADASSEVR